MTQPSPGLGPGRPSRTSIMVAAGRAFGAREPDLSVRNPDWLAERFLGPDERELIREHPIAGALEQDYLQARQNAVVAGTANLMLARTRFVDERLQTALRGGATQVVILGAGFDTRAYRFQDLLKGKKVFEVDFHSTQEFKKRRVAEVLGTAPAHVAFVEIDFKRDALRDALVGAGFQPAEKTFFVWEGVSVYLAEEAVPTTLRAIATSSAPGSSLVMDYACQATIDVLARFPNHPQHQFTTDWGEPWIFGVPDNQEREFFRACGLELRESMSLVRGATLKRYLTRADGTRLGRGRMQSPAAASGQKSRLARAAATAKTIGTLLPLIWLALTRRSQWYALAELVVPARDCVHAQRRSTGPDPSGPVSPEIRWG
jgi:methyltransferase (TIGR00027 family)